MSLLLCWSWQMRRVSLSFADKKNVLIFLITSTAAENEEDSEDKDV